MGSLDGQQDTTAMVDSRVCYISVLSMTGEGQPFGHLAETDTTRPSKQRVLTLLVGGTKACMNAEQQTGKDWLVSTQDRREKKNKDGRGQTRRQ
jgi:hypothetical protein